MNITAADFENLSKIFSNVTFVIIDGTLTITPQPIPPRVLTPHLTVVKTVTSTPKDAEGYAVDEVISYRIVVTNDGEADAHNVVVRDDLTGDSWTIELLAPGATRTFTATYTVTKADADRGTVVNVATATSDDDDPTDPSTPGSTETPILEKIDDIDPPLVNDSAWALINLLAAIGTAITSLILVIKAFGKKKEEEDDEEEVDENGEPIVKEKTEGEEEEEDEEDETTIKRHRLLKVLSILPALAAIITFILTEDMRAPMVLVDKWTILMVIYLVVDLLLGLLSKKKKEEPEDDDDDDQEDENNAAPAEA